MGSGRPTPTRPLAREAEHPVGGELARALSVMERAEPAHEIAPRRRRGECGAQLAVGGGRCGSPLPSGNASRRPWSSSTSAIGPWASAPSASSSRAASRRRRSSYPTPPRAIRANGPSEPRTSSATAIAGVDSSGNSSTASACAARGHRRSERPFERRHQRVRVEVRVGEPRLDSASLTSAAPTTRDPEHGGSHAHGLHPAQPLAEHHEPEHARDDREEAREHCGHRHVAAADSDDERGVAHDLEHARSQQRQRSTCQAQAPLHEQGQRDHRDPEARAPSRMTAAPSDGPVRPAAYRPTPKSEAASTASAIELREL